MATTDRFWRWRLRLALRREATPERATLALEQKQTIPVSRCDCRRHGMLLQEGAHPAVQGGAAGRAGAGAGDTGWLLSEWSRRRAR
ncbi:uncharacterized protein LOC127750818 isoform X2 [Frankliniella occidentalis]|nr:uncharacterized protein LOC127750818 isoform X2 [Frankliniella occidentalis]